MIVHFFVHKTVYAICYFCDKYNIYFNYKPNLAGTSIEVNFSQCINMQTIMR